MPELYQVEQVLGGRSSSARGPALFVLRGILMPVATTRPSGLILMAVSGIVLLIVAAVLIFLPLCRCPMCDMETWNKHYPPSVGIGCETSKCYRCDKTGRMSFYRRWQAVRDLRQRLLLWRIPYLR